MEEETDFGLISSAFVNKQAIPEKYTCRGANLSPPLEIINTPEGTKTLAIVLHDPDAIKGDFLHWTIWNIGSQTNQIVESSIPTGAVEGTTDFNRTGYGGPCPPSGSGNHGYVFNLYALNTVLNLNSGADRIALMDAMNGHVIAQTKLIGYVAAAD